MIFMINDSDYSVCYKWDDDLLPGVTVQNKSGIIKPNSRCVSEFEVRNDQFPIEINGCVFCNFWNCSTDSNQKNNASQKLNTCNWKLWIKIEGSILQRSQVDRYNISTESSYATAVVCDLPIKIDTSLLSPTNQKSSVIACC